MPSPIEIRQVYETSVALPPNRMRFNWIEPDTGRIACHVLSDRLLRLGVPDLSEAGTLPLSGRIVLRPGLRKGVQGYAPPASGPVSYNDPPLSSVVSANRLLRTLTTGEIVATEVCLIANECHFYGDLELIIPPGMHDLVIIANRIVTHPGARIRCQFNPVPDRGPTGGRGTDGRSYNPQCEEDGIAAFHSPSGGNGGAGPWGRDGLAGASGPKIEVWCLHANALPVIEVSGQPGGRGGPGGPGGSGGHGAKGLHSASNVFNCTRGPGYGGNGGAGGAGGRGGSGGRGGDGGSVSLFTVEATHVSLLQSGLRFDLGGGSGGGGGPGGAGGTGGVGGSQGSREGWCARAFGPHDRDGSPGSAGAAGAPGPQGATGAVGSLKACVIGPDDFHEHLNEPLITRITTMDGTPCYQPFSGDSIQVHGRNFASTDSVRLGSTTLDSHFISDELVIASLAGVAPGHHTLVVVEAGSGHTSNAVTLDVRPVLGGVVPAIISLGEEITIHGQGFRNGATLLFRGLELPTSFVSAAELRATLPAPQGPYEEQGGQTLVVVRNPGGLETGSAQLMVRHVIDIGFNPEIHGFGFTNSPTDGTASLSTLSDTFGAEEVAGEAVTHPAQLAAFTAFYLWFFNQLKPGFSSGFSMLAAYEYWNGNNQLRQLYPNLETAKRNLTVAQGHILSAEILRKLHAQSMDGRSRIHKTLQEIEQAFRAQINTASAARIGLAPIVQTIPSGGIFSATFHKNISTSHGLLPIRIEYPVAGETFDARICVYENRGRNGAPQGREKMWIEVWKASGQPECKLVRDPAAGPGEYESKDGWTLSCLSLKEVYLEDVDMPLDVWDFVLP